MVPGRQLHWTQRIALVQHNLHAAARTGDFNFFSNIQSDHFLYGVDYVANLNKLLGDEADKLVSFLDNINCGIAWSFEEGFKSVYEGLKHASESADTNQQPRNDLQNMLLDQFHADITQQHAEADITIDKLISSAISMIKQQPEHVHADAAMSFMLGTTFIADAVQVCLRQHNVLRSCIEHMNMAHAEAAYARVSFAVSAAVSALRGVLNMMELHEDTAGEAVAAHMRRSSVISITSSRGNSVASSRSRGVSQTSNDDNASQPGGFNPGSSFGSSNWNVFRRMSGAMSSNPPPVTSRRDSAASLPSSSGSSSAALSTPHLLGPPQYSTSHTFYPPSAAAGASFKGQPSSHKHRLSMPGSMSLHGHVLSPILCTPVAAATEGDAVQNPFDSSFAMSSPQQNEQAWEINQQRAGQAAEKARAYEPSPTTTPAAAPLSGQARFMDSQLPEHFTHTMKSSLQRQANASSTSLSGAVRHGRRRSTEVRSPPPNLEALKMMSQEAGVAI